MPRRKKKVIRHTPATDDKKLQTALKKMATNNLTGIEEVNMFKDDGHVIHFNNPKVQASLSANTFAISGHSETKPITELLPSVLNQLGPENFAALANLKNIAGKASGNANEESGAAAADNDDDIPELIDEDFEQASKADEGS